MTKKCSDVYYKYVSTYRCCAWSNSILITAAGNEPHVILSLRDIHGQNYITGFINEGWHSQLSSLIEMPLTGRVTQYQEKVQYVENNCSCCYVPQAHPCYWPIIVPEKFSNKKPGVYTDHEDPLLTWLLNMTRKWRWRAGICLLIIDAQPKRFIWSTTWAMALWCSLQVRWQWGRVLASYNWSWVQVYP